MNLELSEEQEAVRQLAKDFVAREIEPHVVEWDRAENVDKSIVKKLGSVGFLASEAAVRAANNALQVFGGYGCIDEYPVGKLLRDARVMTLYEGTSQIQKLIIGRALTGVSAF
ncbi:acyl-CoA dehydrogenase family protein [Streptomyces sp. NPDC056831]|uniref:acyl-CoA dehydrogenase family protein n=1 Tax=Streptomyces sp. NPDC056831 TaxID=3345954 RepID=UPI0036B9828A